MRTNPFIKNIEALQREYDASSSELLEWKKKLAWYENIDIDQQNFILKNAERTASEAQTKAYQAQQAQIIMADSVNELDLKVGMGLDPRYWFSSERSIAKRQLQDKKQELAAQISKIESAEVELSQAKELVRNIQDEISTARAFDPLLAQAAIAALKASLERIESPLARLYQRSNDLEKILREPMQEIRKYEHEQHEIMSQISRAERFDLSLSNARSGFERAKIHEQCDRELGDSKPGNVLRQRRGSLRSIDDKLRKLQSRVDSLIRFATWDIRHIVIDGNNLCYEGKRFLKLAALEALVPILSQKYKVTLIFDASIRRKLKQSNEDIEARFPQSARVHIVTSRHAADETVLATAGDDPHTFVLSNDRFIDYPEKMAVKDDRLLRHEIVNHVIHIHELQIDVSFDITQDIETA